MADEMEWQNDTPTKIFYRSNQPFGQSAHRRSFEEYAEGQQLENHRSVDPSPFIPDAAAFPALSHAYASSANQQRNTPSFKDTPSYGKWLASRQRSYGDHGRAWRYLRQSIDTIGYGVVAVITSNTMKSFCFTGYQAGRYLFTGNCRITQTYVAVAQAANGAKRRIIDITRRRGPPASPRSILLSPEQRRLLRYRERIRSCGKGQDPFQSFTTNGTGGMGETSANPLGYYMSGALQPIESPTHSSGLPGSLPIPGAWVNSPNYGLQTPRSLSIYNPNSPDVMYTSPNGVATQDTVVGNLSLTDTNAVSKMMNGSPSVRHPIESTSANASIADNQPISDTTESDDERLYREEIARIDEEIRNDEIKRAAWLSQTRSMNKAAEVHDPAGLSPIRFSCLNSAGEIDPTALEMQRCYEKLCKFRANSMVVDDDSGLTGESPITGQPANGLNTPQRSSSAFVLNTESPSYDVDLPETPVSQASPIPPWYDNDVDDSPAWSYRGSPLAGLVSPPISFTPPSAPKANSSKKRVAFYSSPKTGQPVNRFKKYVPGTRIDDSYHSTPSENSFSIFNDGNTNVSANPQLHSSPTIQEQLQTTSPMQGVEPASPSADASASPAHTINSEQTEPAVSSQATEQSPPVTPINNILAKKRNKSPSPSDQFVVEVLSPVTFDPPPLYKAPLPVLKQITNGRVRRPEAATFAVTADGSPMRVRSSSASSSSAGTLIHGNGSSSSKENGSSISVGSSPHEKNRSPPSYNQVDVSVRSSSAPSPIAETLIDGDNSSPKENSAPIPNGSSPSKEDDSSPSSNQVDVSVQSSSTISPTAGTLPHGTDSSPTKKNSTPISDGSSLQKENSSQSSNQIDVSVQSFSTISPTAGTLPHGTDSSPTKENSTPIPDGSSLRKENSSQSSNQVDVSVDPVTPDRVATQFANLNVSVRRFSLRSSSKAESEDRRRVQEEARIAAEKARKEKEEAVEKARKAKEAEEERKKSGARRMPVEKIIQPLPAEWEIKVDQALSESMGKILTSTSTGTTLTRRDLGKIVPQPGVPGEDPRGWLNDDVVLGYLQAIVDHGLHVSGHKRGQTPTLHAFNTFFYTNLSTKGPDSIRRWAGKAKIGGKDLLKVEHVFIPVNHGGMHWTLLVVSPKYNLIEYFDSFHGDSKAVLGNAVKWLKLELGDAFVETEWRKVGRAGPRQTNGSDCGVFTATTAKMVMLGVDPMAYSASDIPTQRRRMVAELLNRGFTGEFTPNILFGDE